MAGSLVSLHVLSMCVPRLPPFLHTADCLTRALFAEGADRGIPDNKRFMRRRWHPLTYSPAELDTISALDSIVYCDDAILEGSASFTSLGTLRTGASNAKPEGGKVEFNLSHAMVGDMVVLLGPSRPAD